MASLAQKVGWHSFFTKRIRNQNKWSASEYFRYFQFNQFFERPDGKASTHDSGVLQEIVIRFSVEESEIVGWWHSSQMFETKLIAPFCPKKETKKNAVFYERHDVKTTYPLDGEVVLTFKYFRPNWLTSLFPDRVWGVQIGST